MANKHHKPEEIVSNLRQVGFGWTGYGAGRRDLRGQYHRQPGEIAARGGTRQMPGGWLIAKGARARSPVPGPAVQQCFAIIHGARRSVLAKRLRCFCSQDDL